MPSRSLIQTNSMEMLNFIQVSKRKTVFKYTNFLKVKDSAKTSARKSAITSKSKPEVATGGADQLIFGRWKARTESTDQRRETKGTVPHLQEIHATKRFGFKVEGLGNSQIYPMIL